MILIKSEEFNNVKTGKSYRNQSSVYNKTSARNQTALVYYMKFLLYQQLYNHNTWGHPKDEKHLGFTIFLKIIHLRPL